MIVYIPAAENRFVISSGWYWFHPLAHKTGPVVPEDIVNPPWQGLVTVACHLRALLCVLKVQGEKYTAVGNTTIQV